MVILCFVYISDGLIDIYTVTWYCRVCHPSSVRLTIFILTRSLLRSIFIHFVVIIFQLGRFWIKQIFCLVTSSRRTDKIFIRCRLLIWKVTAPAFFTICIFAVTAKISDGLFRCLCNHQSLLFVCYLLFLVCFRFKIKKTLFI